MEPLNKNKRNWSLWKFITSLSILSAFVSFLGYSVSHNEDISCENARKCCNNLDSLNLNLIELSISIDKVIQLIEIPTDIKKTNRDDLKSIINRSKELENEFKQIGDKLIIHDSNTIVVKSIYKKNETIIRKFQIAVELISNNTFTPEEVKRKVDDEVEKKKSSSENKSSNDQSQIQSLTSEKDRKIKALNNILSIYNEPNVTSKGKPAKSNGDLVIAYVNKLDAIKAIVLSNNN